MKINLSKTKFGNLFKTADGRKASFVMYGEGPNYEKHYLLAIEGSSGLWAYNEDGTHITDSGMNLVKSVDYLADEYNWACKERGDCEYVDDTIIDAFTAGFIESQNGLKKPSNDKALNLDDFEVFLGRAWHNGVEVSIPEGYLRYRDALYKERSAMKCLTNYIKSHWS